MSEGKNVKLENDVVKQLVLKQEHDYLFKFAREVEATGDLSVIRSFEPTDFGNTEAMFYLFPNRFIKTDAFGLMVYNGKCWEKDNAEDLTKVAAIEVLRLRQLSIGSDTKTYSELYKKSVRNSPNINSLSNLFIDRCEFVKSEQFNAIPYLLNVNNGVIDLRTGQLLEHDFEYYFTSYTKVDRVVGATSSMFQEFLESSIYDYSNPVMREYVQKVLGYCITGETNREKLVYMYGPQGRNGKGTLTTVLKALVNGLAASTSFTTFTKKRDGSDQGFDIAPLHDKRIVFASESGKTDAMNEQLVKNVTGNDEITASFKGRDHFNFKPRWKIMLASNFKPRGDFTDNAFWVRFDLLYFPNTFIGKENLSLKAELCSKDNLEGILNWIIEGAIMYYNNPIIETPVDLVNLLENFRGELDTVQRWLDNATINSRMLEQPLEPGLKEFLLLKGITWSDVLIKLNSKNSWATHKELYNHYVDWCSHNDESYPLGRPNFTDALGKKSFVDKGKSRLGTKVDRHFEGIFMFQGNGDFMATLEVMLKDLPNMSTESQLVAEYAKR